VGALRRPAYKEARPESLYPGERPEAAPDLKRYPRWTAVWGVIIYCALVWALLFALGAWGWAALHASAAPG
jgi:hypothetical protein